MAESLPIAFGIEFGEISRRNGDCVFDIDRRLLARSLRQSGLDTSSFDNHPIVIQNLGRCANLDGECYEDGSPNGIEYDNDQGYLALYTNGGYGPIKPETATHEGRTSLR